MEKALFLIKKCLDSIEPTLNLSMCGLGNEDLQPTSKVGKQLAKCTHLTKLVLSNYQYKWRLNAPPLLFPNSNYKYKVRGRYWEDRKTRPTDNYFNDPDFKPLIYTERGLENKLSEIPAVIQNLTNLEELVCGGDPHHNWGIHDLIPLQGLPHLKTLILNHNSIEDADYLHLFPHLEKIDFSNNNIKHVSKIEGHPRLKALDLSGNKIKKLNTINLYPSLEWLSVSNNALQTMDGLQDNTSLRVLDLSNNFISIYEPFKKNQALTTLHLSNNLLKELPDLKNTPRLQYLYARCNKIHAIAGIKALKSLQVLDLSNNLISRIPAEFSMLQDLTILDLSNNIIKCLNNISELEKLKVLIADNNQITDVKCDTVLSSMRVLLLNNNKLSDLHALSSFPLLKRLYAADNQIEKIVTGKHVPLSVVVLYNNKIKELPFLSSCRNLIYLDLSNNCLQELERKVYYRKLAILLAENNELSGAFTFENYPRLTHLNLSTNNIRRIGGMKNFPYLKTVRLHFNVIEYIFTWSNMPVLSYLGFQNNRIKEIADNLKFLPRLKELDANGNQITKIPDLTLFPKLERLNLSDNRITEFEKINCYPALQELYLMQNHIVAINDISQLFKFSTLNLSFNPINRAQELLRFFKKNQQLEVTYKEDSTLEVCLEDKKLLLNSPYFDVPPQILHNDSQGIKDWLIARGQGGYINLEVRCILFGNGETGKTALSHYLRVDEFYALNNRTHGILIESWEVDRGDWPEDFTQAVLDSVVLKELDVQNLDMSNIFTFNIWDFGGQEFYHATHRLFMSTDVLYLVMWEKEIDFQDEGKGNFPKEYWIKNIQHYAAGSSILLVQNRADQQFYVEKNTCYKIGVYDEKHPKRVEQFKLDISALKEGIFKSVSKLPHFAMYTPKIYHLIKSFIKDIRKPYITFSDYESICEYLDDTPEQIMSEASQRESLIKYLDNIGSVVCFRHRDRMNDPLMKDYIFTNAKWLTKVIYEILEKGVNEFDYAHVERIVSQYQLSPEVWIKVMQNFGLIFEVKSKQGNKYVAPQYLPSKCKNESALEFALACKKMHCVFTISYPLFMPNSNFLRLISNYGSEHVNFLYWKNGLVFFREEKTVFIECVNTVNERKVKVHVQDNDQQVAADIFDCIVEIDPNDSMEVSVDQDNYVPLSVLNKKVKANRVEVDASNGETLSTRDFKFLFKNRHGGKAIHQKKITIRICILYRSQDEILQELLVKGLMAHLKNKPDFDFEIWIDNNIEIGEGTWTPNMKEKILKCDVAILFVSAGFALSYYNIKDKVNKIVVKDKNDRFLILPVLVRNYEYGFFESLIKTPFLFKTCYGEYGNTLPFFRDRIMPFDVLAENDKTEEIHLNNYYKNLADTLYKAVSEKFSGNA